jgi:hypothetical protein
MAVTFLFQDADRRGIASTIGIDVKRRQPVPGFIPRLCM